MTKGGLGPTAVLGVDPRTIFRSYSGSQDGFVLDVKLYDGAKDTCSHKHFVRSDFPPRVRYHLDKGRN